jgi:hypothetical protein
VVLLSLAPIAAFAFGFRDLYPRLAPNNLKQFATGDRGQTIDSPDSLVPFSADFNVWESNSLTVVGRYHRASNGSVRMESGPDTTDVRFIHIINVPELTEYAYSKKAGKWLSKDSPHAAGKSRPRRFRQNLPNWTLLPTRLAIRKGESGSLEASEGLSAYRVDNGETISLMVPDLNFFPVVTQRLDGNHQTFTNLEIMEPPEELFRLPEGEIAEHR